jgi:hypothetical protein
MILPQRVALRPDTTGLYESYYFRGNSLDGSVSFWLKHNFLKYFDTCEVQVDNALILFQHQTQKTQVFNQSILLDSKRFFGLESVRGESWDSFRFEFGSDAYFEIGEKMLCGSMPSPGGKVSWNLKLERSGESYYHFSNDWFYRGFFPKKKILTRDIRLGFRGKLEGPGFKVDNEFVGINGHNWGKEHAYLYAYANCSQWENGEDAFFDGFSSKIILGGRQSPYLSLCSLKYKGQWFYFNQVLRSYRPKVRELGLKKWSVVFSNGTHSLDIEIDGSDSTWVSLLYAHPSRKQSTVNNTKTARGVLKLSDEKSGEVFAELQSKWFELETLVGG